MRPTDSVWGGLRHTGKSELWAVGLTDSLQNEQSKLTDTPMKRGEEF